MQELAIKIVVALLGVLLVINFVVAKSYKLSAFDIQLDLDLSVQPTTTINFPPVGRITAATHLTPVDLKVMLEAIHKDKLTAIIEEIETKEELIELLQSKAETILQLFVWRLLLLAALGGMVGALIIETNHSSLLQGLAVGVVVVILVVVTTYYSYNLQAFADPNFVGMLEAAPWMINLIQEGINDIEQLSSEVELITSNMAQLFNKVDTLRPLSQVTGDLNVLHISDIHNNPVALSYVAQIVDSFQVDFIVDTGDITDYGTPVEGQLLERVNKLNVPYIFIAGNHDSPEIIDKMNDFSNVTVLTSDLIEVEGLTIAGVADPAASGNKIKPLNKEEMQESKDKLDKLVSGLEKKPDIIATHHFTIAKELLGASPVILHGHDHSFKVYKRKDSTIVDAGTTGAAGVRGFETQKKIPYSVALLHYDQSEDAKQVKIIDIIKFYSRHSGFMLERKLIGNSQTDQEQNGGQ
ncbi:metallophosphoesterase family protein [Halanaerobaculum tunisiense]